MTSAVPPPAPPSGLFDGARHLFPVRIYFANYLRYMERARSDMLRLAGIDQRTANEAGEGAWAVTDLAIRYRLPARLDDDLLVESTVTAVRGASVEIVQTISCGGRVLTEARVTAAFVSPEGRARRQPAGWADRFRSIMNANPPSRTGPE